MAQKTDGGSGLTPEMRKLLQELGRSQTAYREYGAAGRSDLQANAHRYADQLRTSAQGMGFDLTPHATQNQFGNNFESWYTPPSQGAAGQYDPSKAGYSLAAQPPAPPATPDKGNGGAGAPAAAAPVDTGKPATTPLPSSQFKDINKVNAAPPIDWNAINGRASRDAHMQVGSLAQQANRGYDRFASEGQAQIQALQQMYQKDYRNNAEATQMSARDALQRSASRGFLASGIAGDAEQKANLRGEQMRMDLAAQESGQVGDITKRISMAGQERNDTLSGLASHEQDLMAQLVDRYGQTALDNNFREQSLNTQTALSLLGMDQQFNQFNEGLVWDKNKFTQQLDLSKLQRGDQLSQFDRTLNEQVANRLQQHDQFGQDLAARGTWHGQDIQQSKDQMGMQDKWHTADDTFKRDDMAMHDKWQGWEQTFRGDTLAMQRADHAATSQFHKDSLTLQRSGQDAENFFKYQNYLDGKGDKTFAKNQLTAKYMDEADWMLGQIKSGNPDPELKARGVRTPDDIVRWYSDRGMKIVSEGGNLSDLIQYIRQRSGAGYSSPGAGPIAPPKNPYDPYGMYRR